MVRAMADKNFVEDYVFWEKFAFKYVDWDIKRNMERTFTESEARQLWDTIVYLKIKCPPIDIREVLMKLEKYMPKENAKIEE
jgi:hypothetical protein